MNWKAKELQVFGGLTSSFAILNILWLSCKCLFSGSNKGGFVVSISITVQPTLLTIKIHTLLRFIQQSDLIKREKKVLFVVLLYFSPVRQEIKTAFLC